MSDDGVNLLRSLEQNWIPRSPGWRVLKPLEPLPDPKPKLTPRQLEAMVERQARLENRAIIGQGRRRRFRDTTAKDLNQIIKGAD